MRFTVNQEFEPTVSISLVSVENEVHVLATDSFGESWTIATLNEDNKGGLRICSDVPGHLGLDVDSDGEIRVSFDSDEEEF